MSLFPSERARQKSDRRTAVFFLKVIAFVMFAFAVIVGVHYLLGWW